MKSSRPFAVALLAAVLLLGPLPALAQQAADAPAADPQAPVAALQLRNQLRPSLAQQPGIQRLPFVALLRADPLMRLLQRHLATMTFLVHRLPHAFVQLVTIRLQQLARAFFRCGDQLPAAAVLLTA